MVEKSDMQSYKENLVNRYWNYQKIVFPKVEDYFERSFQPDGRPPVFLKRTEQMNVLLNPDANVEEIHRILNLIPIYERHRWFRSMNSSQALAQSVLGNLMIYDRLQSLSELSDEFGEPLFGDANISLENFSMEYKVDYLKEPRRTSVDGFISGDYQVAIECKFTEPEVGPCSRPKLTKQSSNYETDFCNGTYTYQKNRNERCSLSKRGILYWKYVPLLFKWQNDRDLTPCPLHKNYQLVRNILAACIRPDGALLPEKGHVVLIYDKRNPAFKRGGEGFVAFEETRGALQTPNLLKKCSWQRIIRHLRNKNYLSWLTEQLELKYGL